MRGSICASSAVCLELNLACLNFDTQKQPGKPSSTLADVVPVQPAWENEYLLLPERHGPGIEFNRAAAQRHPLAKAKGPPAKITKLGTFRHYSSSSLRAFCGIL